MKIKSDEEFIERVKFLADASDMDKHDKKCYSMFIAYACDTAHHKQQIFDYLSKDGITFRSLVDYVSSILPKVEITDDE